MLCKKKQIHTKKLGISMSFPLPRPPCNHNVFFTPDLEQRTIFRQRNHISPHFTLMIFSILKQNLTIFFKLLVKVYWNSLTKEERNLFLFKIKKLHEIQNKWRNIVTWRNMVLHSTSLVLVGCVPCRPSVSSDLYFILLLTQAAV